MECFIYTGMVWWLLVLLISFIISAVSGNEVMLFLQLLQIAGCQVTLFCVLDLFAFCWRLYSTVRQLRTDYPKYQVRDNFE